MILDHLPLELSLSLDHLSGTLKEICVKRLRRDLITKRIERAYQVLRHEVPIQQETNKIILEPRMRA
jgi:hypothetical protein